MGQCCNAYRCAARAVRYIQQPSASMLAPVGVIPSTMRAHAYCERHARLVEVRADKMALAMIEHC